MEILDSLLSFQLNSSTEVSITQCLSIILCTLNSIGQVKLLVYPFVADTLYGLYQMNVNTVLINICNICEILNVTIMQVTTTRFPDSVLCKIMSFQLSLLPMLTRTKQRSQRKHVALCKEGNVNGKSEYLEERGDGDGGKPTIKLQCCILQFVRNLIFVLSCSWSFVRKIFFKTTLYLNMSSTT